jgi:hypothetical protein
LYSPSEYPAALDTKVEDTIAEESASEYDVSLSQPGPAQTYNIYSRVFSPEHDDYFFVSKTTKRTQWDQPTVGIVVSTDDQNGREFFTCCETGLSAWTFDDLLRKKDLSK